MKTKIIDKKGCKRILEIEVSTEEVKVKFEEVYKKITKAASIPGFRAGKAPQDIVEKKYKTKAEEEVLKELVSSSYEDAIESLKIIPVELPKIKDIKLEEGKPLTYKAEVDIKPEVNLKRYKGFKINKAKVKVEDTDVDKALVNLQELRAKFITADARAVVTGDYVICDLSCSSEGKEVFKKEGMWLSSDEGAGIKELHEGIVGMKKDEEKEITAKLPKDYPDKNLAEKEVLYKVKINHVKEKKLPQLDDEFAKDLGKANMQELKEAAKNDLLKRAELSVNEGMRRQIIDNLLKNSSFDAPESMVVRHLNHLVNEAKERLRSQGINDKDIESNNSAIEEKLKMRAVNEVKLLFLLNEVARQEQIKVEPSEIDRAAEIMAAQFNKDKNKLLKEYEERNLLDQLIGQIREEKTMEFLLKESDVTEK